MVEALMLKRDKEHEMKVGEIEDESSELKKELFRVNNENYQLQEKHMI